VVLAEEIVLELEWSALELLTKVLLEVKEMLLV
jgi:hypothetical protein